MRNVVVFLFSTIPAKNQLLKWDTENAPSAHSSATDNAAGKRGLSPSLSLSNCWRRGGIVGTGSSLKETSFHRPLSLLLKFQQASRLPDPTESKKARAAAFIVTVKQTLSKLNFDTFSRALQQYKNTDDFDTMLSQMSALFAENQEKHALLRGMAIT